MRTSVADLCCEHGMSDATFYKWRSKYGGMDASLMKRMKELEDENRRLKKMYAEEKLIACIEDPVVIKKILAHLIEQAPAKIKYVIPEGRSPPQKSLFTI